MFNVSIDLLVESIAWVESRWRPHLVSPAGAVGYYQIKSSTAQWLGYSSRILWNKDKAREVAVRYFKWLLNYFDGDYKKAISAYNYGPGNVSRGKYSLKYYYRVLGALLYLTANKLPPQHNSDLENAGFLYELFMNWSGFKIPKTILVSAFNISMLFLPARRFYLSDWIFIPRRREEVIEL